MYIPAKVDEGRVRKTLMNVRKGLIRKEKIEGVKLVWVPVALLKLRIYEKERFANRPVNVVELINVYELVSGQWTGLSFSTPPELREEEELKPKAEKKVEVEELLKRIEGLNILKNHLMFAAYGISANAEGVDVLEVVEAYYPFYIGKIVGKGERFVAVSGVSGNIAGLRVAECLFNLTQTS